MEPRGFVVARQSLPSRLSFRVAYSDLLPSQIESLRRMTPSQRLAKGLRFLKMARGLLEAGVRARHPEWTLAQVAAETRRLIDRGDR